MSYYLGMYHRNLDIRLQFGGLRKSVGKREKRDKEICIE